jgi:hypothetical protein
MGEAKRRKAEIDRLKRGKKQKTAKGNEYTDKVMVLIREAMPNAVAEGRGRDFFEQMIDAMSLTMKMDKGLPPSSPQEEKDMAIANAGLDACREYCKTKSMDGPAVATFNELIDSLDETKQ